MLFDRCRVLFINLIQNHDGSLSKHVCKQEYNPNNIRKREKFTLCLILSFASAWTVCLVGLVTCAFSGCLVGPTTCVVPVVVEVPTVAPSILRFSDVCCVGHY